MKYKNNEDYIGEEVSVKGYKAPRYKKVEEDIPTVKIKDSKPKQEKSTKKDLLKSVPPTYKRLSFKESQGFEKKPFDKLEYLIIEKYIVPVNELKDGITYKFSVDSLIDQTNESNKKNVPLRKFEYYSNGTPEKVLELKQVIDYTIEPKPISTQFFDLAINEVKIPTRELVGFKVPSTASLGKDNYISTWRKALEPYEKLQFISDNILSNWYREQLILDLKLKAKSKDLNYLGDYVGSSSVKEYIGNNLNEWAAINKNLIYKKNKPTPKPTPKAIQKDIKVDYRLSDEELNKKYSKELKAIENAYLKHFPNGGVKAYFKSVIGSPSLYVKSVLIKERKNQTSGLFDNDPLRMNFLGFIKDNGQIELENTQGVLWVNPPKDSFLAMGRVKALKRKQTTTLDKHIINLEKHYKKVAKIFDDNKDNLYKKDIDKKYLKVIL